MDHCRKFLHLFLYLLLSASFFIHTHSSEDYKRQPPRPLLLTWHHGTDFDPQQFISYTHVSADFRTTIFLPLVSARLQYLVHISLVGKDDMKISWVTSHEHVKSMVEYGKRSGKYEASATGEHTSYQYFWYRSGKIHHVTIGPLDPKTTYYYRCGGSGQEFKLRTPPSIFPIEFAIAGDLGQTEWTASTLAHIGSNDYDVLLLPGDLSYADTQQPLWDSFGRLVEPYASQRPWMVTQGNHEIESFPIIFPHGFKAYNSRWQMPYQQSGSKSNLYYSFDVAGTHIIMLGSYAHFDASSDQYTWLKADLAKLDKSKNPWTIVLIHAPWYTSNTAHKGEGESMRLAMEEMLYNAGVDIVYAGHVHAYERFARVYDNKADQCGPVHVTIGDGGNREGLAMLFEKPSPSISIYREPSFGHGRLKIFNQTHARWSWQRNNDSNSFAADEVWLSSLSYSNACCNNSSSKCTPLTTQNDEL